MTGKSALLIGGTGAVGKRLLAELLASDEWARVGDYGRRVTTPPSSQSEQAKLEQKVIDFEDLGKADLKAGRWDVVFVTLGTTRAKAGSAAQFEKIDRECVAFRLRVGLKYGWLTQFRTIGMSCVRARPQRRTTRHMNSVSCISRYVYLFFMRVASSDFLCCRPSVCSLE